MAAAPCEPRASRTPVTATSANALSTSTLTTTRISPRCGCGAPSPLGEDLDERYTTVDPREGGRVTANVVQIDRQMLETPFGLTYDTWVLQIRTGRETVNVWIHVNPPHEVVRFDNGRLFFELEWAGLR